MKIISFAIPSYNSENYLRHCVDTILTGGEDVEILIVNDGSTDGTAAIADEYQAKYPTIVRAIHKPNGGHGSGVNKGMEEATGLYYKVVDSDDWVSEKALAELLATIKGHLSKHIEADLYLTNFIYDHVQDNTRFVRHWRRNFPVNKFCTWQDAKDFHGAEVILMHSVLYKTELLRSMDLKLPEHTFYVDNVFAFKPLPKVNKIFYLDVDLYHYFIGRDDQSVNIKNLKKRYDHQIRCMRAMVDAYSYDEIMQMVPGLRKYVLHCLSAIMCNTIMFCCAGGDDEQRRKDYQELLDHIKTNDPKLYDHIFKKDIPAVVAWMPWKMRGAVSLFGYNALCKMIKLG